MKVSSRSLLIAAVVLLSSFILLRPPHKPVLFLIGDSTVKNGKGKGDNQQWGWGSFLSEHFDTSRISIQNHALGGTSSRTFRTRGLWNEVLKALKPGDYVIMQFGHNDGSPLDDTARARGTIKGTGNEMKEIYNPITRQQEVVHTYGWYLSAFIREAKEKGAMPIVCSPVPRNNWKDGKIVRGADGYASWAQETAEKAGALFIDLNQIICGKYEQLGQPKVSSMFPSDHTHTNIEGARINAAGVAEGIRMLKQLPLQQYLLSSTN